VAGIVRQNRLPSTASPPDDPHPGPPPTGAGIWRPETLRAQAPALEQKGKAPLAHAAAAKAAGPAYLDEQRAEAGMRPGGLGILLAQGVVDELIYSETGDEVLMIKHTA